MYLKKKVSKSEIRSPHLQDLKLYIFFTAKALFEKLKVPETILTYSPGLSVMVFFCRGASCQGTRELFQIFIRPFGHIDGIVTVPAQFDI